MNNYNQNSDKVSHQYSKIWPGGDARATAHGLAEASEKVVGSKMASEETGLQILTGKPREPIGEQQLK